MLVLDKSGTACKICCYNVTKDRFFFHFDWLGNGTTTSGVFNSGVIHLGAQQLLQRGNVASEAPRAEHGLLVAVHAA